MDNFLFNTDPNQRPLYKKYSDYLAVINGESAASNPDPGIYTVKKLL